MKKIAAMCLVLLLLASLAACDGNSNDVDPNLVITRPTETTPTEETSEQTQPEETQETQKPQDQVFAVTWNGVTIVPGEPFDTTALPEPASVYQVPSCAVEGTDNVYNYQMFEVTAFEEAGVETVYCIYFIDPNMKTAEGLATGDSLEDAVALYGTDYTVEGTAYIYTRGNTILRLITQNNIVISIEYFLNTAA